MTVEDQTDRTEMMAKLEKGMELMRRRYGTATEEYFAEMKKFGIELNEEKIVEDYAKVKDAEALFKSYYQKYYEVLDSDHENAWLNTDVFMELIDRIIPGHFDFEETGDPLFISTAVDEICSKDPKKISQQEIEKVMRGLVTYSKTRDCHTLEDTLELSDMNGLLKELIRLCHNRDASFRALVREMYECFEDMDPKIFPSVYKEILRTRK